MATYKKRGYKPKNKKEQETATEEQSTTAEVFNNLDEGAGKTEEWVARNQKPIFGIIAVVVIAVLAYIGYTKFVMQPQEEEAANEMAQSQIYFESAIQAEGAQQDSLYNLAVTGGAGKFGFEDITNEYSGTNAGNLAHYYAGMAYLNMGEYKKAINHLEQFNSEDEVLAPLAKGAMGDAFVQNGQPEEALEYYEQAAKMRDNEFITPKFLLKAGTTALEIGKPEVAREHLRKLEEDYANTPEAEKAKIFIGSAEAK